MRQNDEEATIAPQPPTPDGVLIEQIPILEAARISKSKNEALIRLSDLESQSA